MTYIIKIRSNTYEKLEELDHLLKENILFEKLYHMTSHYMVSKPPDSKCSVLNLFYIAFSMANFAITKPHSEQYFDQLEEAVKQYVNPLAFPIIAKIAYTMIIFIKPRNKTDLKHLSVIKYYLWEVSKDEHWLDDLYFSLDYWNFHTYDFHDFDGCITVEENIVPLVEWNLEPEQKARLNQAHINIERLKGKDDFGYDMISDEDFSKTVRLFDNFIINGTIPDLEGELIKTVWKAADIRKVFHDIFELYRRQNNKDYNGHRFVKFMHSVFAAFDGIAESTTYRNFAKKTVSERDYQDSMNH